MRENKAFFFLLRKCRTHPVVGFTAPVLASLLEPLLWEAAEDGRGGICQIGRCVEGGVQRDSVGGFITLQLAPPPPL